MSKRGGKRVKGKRKGMEQYNSSGRRNR